MKKIILILITMFIGCVHCATPLLAFDMTKYYPLKPGTVWIFDRDHSVVGSKTHAFNYYTGIQILSGDGTGEYIYYYSGPEGILGVGLQFGDTFIDLEDTPLKLASADMSINEEIVTIIPAGRIDNDPITFTVMLVDQETITVPAGQFVDTLVLQIRIDDSPATHYIEKVWLAEGVGPVKYERVSESPFNHEGCLYTCRSFDYEPDPPVVDQRIISLESLLGPPLIDTNNDGIAGMEEVIYILQTMSNSR